MDTRIDPLAIFSIKIGDAKIIRNAGGRVTQDTLRSLILAKAFLGVKKILIMHHTECALANTTNAEIEKNLPVEMKEFAAHIDFLPMENPDGALHEDVNQLLTNTALSEVEIEGWRYDVQTGKASRIFHS